MANSFVRYTGNGSRAFPEPIAKPVSLIGEKEAYVWL